MNNLSNILAILSLSAILVLPQSYALFKQVLLVAYFAFSALILLMRNELILNVKDGIFYAIIIFVGLVWAIIGVFNQNDMAGVYSGLRLYVVWSLVFLVVVSILRGMGQVKLLHIIIIISGLVISILTLIAIYDDYSQAGIISADAREELGLHVVFHGSYIKIHSHNIASLFFIFGYLLAVKFCKATNEEMPRLSTITLFLCMATIILSGRRALWLTAMFAPLLILSLAYVSRGATLLSRGAKIFTSLYIIFILFFWVLSIFGLNLFDQEVVSYINSSFSIEDERTIQKSYLVNSFFEHFFLGSGFGGEAGYLRNQYTPWLYELTYHQMLFNLGVVGSGIIIFTFLYYTRMALWAIKFEERGYIISFGVLVGFFLYCIGSYSNPYFQFFDGLFFVSLFVLVSSYSGNRKSTQFRCIKYD